MVALFFRTSPFLLSRAVVGSIATEVEAPPFLYKNRRLFPTRGAPVCPHLWVPRSRFEKKSEILISRFVTKNRDLVLRSVTWRQSTDDTNRFFSSRNVLFFVAFVRNDPSCGPNGRGLSKTTWKTMRDISPQERATLPKSGFTF